MDVDFTASALFSPSKARAQQAQAKDWAAVDAWLAKRYASRPPNVERNEDTLQALLAIANLNESADEQRGHVERIEKTAYQTMSKRQAGILEDVVQTMLVELANETHIDTLAEFAVASDCSNSHVSVMAGKIIDLMSAEFDLAQQVKRAEAHADILRDEQVRLQKLLGELKSGDYQAPSELLDSTGEWQRATKHLKAKIGEYEERLAASRVNTASISFETVTRQRDELDRHRTQLASTEAQLQAFQDLPTDPRAARQQLETARQQLRDLTAKRDELFESLVDG